MMSNEVCGQCGAAWPTDATVCRCGWRVSMLRAQVQDADAKPLDSERVTVYLASADVAKLLDALHARVEKAEATLDRYAAALAHIAERGQHANGCHLVPPPCDCDVCPDRHGGDPATAAACPAVRHYAHGPDCAACDRTRQTMACAPECPTATAKRALEDT